MLIVVLIATGAVAGFVFSFISPIEHEINELIKQVPIWRAEIASGKAPLATSLKHLHLSNSFGGKSTGSLAQDLATGALGAGEFVLSGVSDFLIVVVLTVISWPRCELSRTSALTWCPKAARGPTAPSRVVEHHLRVVSGIALPGMTVKVCGSQRSGPGRCWRALSTPGFATPEGADLRWS